MCVLQSVTVNKPVPVAAPSKASVCGPWPAEIVGSNPTGGMSVCRECCVFSGRCLCDELIPRPKESYRLWCVVVCGLETARMRRSWPAGGCCPKINKNSKKKNTHTILNIIRNNTSVRPIGVEIMRKMLNGRVIESKT